MHITANVHRHHPTRIIPGRAAAAMFAAADQLKDLLADHHHEWSHLERADTERVINQLAAAGTS